jgi:DNA repair exonuclease SbcCD ATPase subunit
MFNKLFGGGKKEKPKEPKAKIDETLQTLNKKISDLELLTQNLDVRQKNLQEEAKQKLKAGDKAGAKRLLTKKKKLLDQLKQTEGAIAMMEEQKMTLESAGATKEIIDTLKATNQIVKDAMKELNIESLEELKEEMEEAKAAQEELNNFFTDYANEQMDEVEDELKALEEEEAQKNKNAMPVANKEEINVEKKNKVNNEEFNLDNFLNS